MRLCVSLSARRGGYRPLRAVARRPLGIDLRPSMNFVLAPNDTGCLLIHGTDDMGEVFQVTLDRIWVGNLVLDLERWLKEGEVHGAR